MNTDIDNLSLEQIQAANAKLQADIDALAAELLAVRSHPATWLNSLTLRPNPPIETDLERLASKSGTLDRLRTLSRASQRRALQMIADGRGEERITNLTA